MRNFEGVSTIASRILYSACFLMFCFAPFTTVSCYDAKGNVTQVVSQSGIQAAFGGRTTSSASGAGSSSRLSGANARPLMKLYGVALLAGLAISVTCAWKRGAITSELVISVVAFVALVTQYFLLSDYRKMLGRRTMDTYGATEGEMGVALILSTLFTLVLAIISAARFFAARMATNIDDELSSMPQQPAGFQSSD